jgi:hypothetical protein
VQLIRIFTDMSISPSLSPRQCPDRYAFRAGRNLPDNEFRYLRTVIVTAAVHRGFGRQLLLTNNQLPSPSGTGQASAPIDRLTTLRRPVFLVNSRLGLFSATSLSEAFLLPKLRNYFAEFLRESYLAPLSMLYYPTCVGYGYGFIYRIDSSSFSWKYDVIIYMKK